MSLAQLLTVGRSFRGGKDGPNSYRLSVQPLLPKFQQPAMEPKVGEPLTVATVQPEPAHTRVVKETPKRQPTRREAAAAGQTWWKRLAFWRQPVLSAPPGRMRQQRLCLEEVHVVRNDLFEADLEVVPVRKDRSAPVVREARASRQGSSWVSLSVRFWNSQRSRL